jgi:hypothetical protein
VEWWWMKVSEASVRERRQEEERKREKRRWRWRWASEAAVIPGQASRWWSCLPELEMWESRGFVLFWFIYAQKEGANVVVLWLWLWLYIILVVVLVVELS